MGQLANPEKLSEEIYQSKLKDEIAMCMKKNISTTIQKQLKEIDSNLTERDGRLLEFIWNQISSLKDELMQSTNSGQVLYKIKINLNYTQSFKKYHHTSQKYLLTVQMLQLPILPRLARTKPLHMIQHTHTKQNGKTN